MKWERLTALFLSERHNWFLWIAVWFGIGICLYFSLPEEPPLWIGLGWVVLSITMLYVGKRYAALLLLASISLITSLGFVNAETRTMRQVAPVIPKLYRALEVKGIVTDIDLRPTGCNLFLRPLSIDHIASAQLPKYIRLVVRTPLGGAKPGDTIRTLAIINPPPVPVYPGAYDFARIAYFQQVGGVGYTLKPVEILEPARSNHILIFISNLRKDITLRIIDVIGKEHGSIAAALLVGESNAIPKVVYDDIRASGLAHLISISGLHLSLVVGIFYALSRRLFALSETLALRFNIKKWAAICGLVGSACYLLLAGMPIPAQRSYIMASLVLLAILIDRTPSPMRCVAWAALVILVFEPESLLTPSFQMSFAAVAALIAGYQVLSPLLPTQDNQLPGNRRRLHSHICLYIIGIIISTVIAGFATLPFSIYHFNNYSSYSILANLVAIPLTSFWVMPWGVLALLLYPFHLDGLALYPMRLGVEAIIWTAHKVANFPYAAGFVPSLSPYGFALIGFGMCWLLLWEKRWRLAGLPMIVLGTLTVLSFKAPDVIIDQNTKLFAVKTPQGELVFNNNHFSHYTRHIWMQRIGQAHTILASERAGLTCGTEQCTYENGKITVVFVKEATALHEACSNADIVVNLTRETIPCPAPFYTLTRKDLYRKGTHALWFDENNNIAVKTVKEMRGDRLWITPQ